MKATEETKAKAKDAGIKSWHIKSEETLQAELGQAPVEEKSEPKQMSVEDLEKLIDMIGNDGGTFAGALMSAKLNGPKSKYSRYKDYLEKKVNGN